MDPAGEGWPFEEGATAVGGLVVSPGQGLGPKAPAMLSDALSS
jgi:hypothetical protein